MKTIEILITPEGKTTVQTLGFVGQSCRDASLFIEQALGQRTAERRTSEFYETENALNVQSQRA